MGFTMIKELNHDEVLSLLPDRAPDGHKGSFGKLLLLCGSRGYTGAAYMAAMGALRCGAGLVFLGVPESIYAIEAVKLNEPIVFPLPDEDGMYSAEALEAVQNRLADMDAVLIGCGMGKSSGTFAVLEVVLKEARCPVIVDADGINLLQNHMDLLRGRKYPTILTPHEGEFRRIASLGDDRMESAVEYALRSGAIVLLKGHRSCITDGNVRYINPTGNPGMATGGSGDVLAGMIAGLIGQGLLPMEAAACGAWLHGAAGDLCAKEMGQYAMLPTDMLEILPRLLK